MQTSVAFCLSVIQFIIIRQISYVSTGNLSEDATLNSVGLAKKYGHPPTKYDVVTEDGYILAVYRLPGKSRIPVLLAHGLTDSSDSWLIRGNTSLAIALANRGHDVWLANSRGNRYSRRHKFLDPDTDPAFWQFSFHEMGYYDLPAIIDTILNVTGANNLTAIGHSQGNTGFYVLGSERKQYNAKINVMIALAPVAYLHNAPPPLSIGIQLSPIINKLTKRLSVHEFLGDKGSFSRLFHRVCSTPATGYIICLNGLLFPAMGFDPAEIEETFFQTVMKHYPAGSSIMSVLHFLQVGYRKIFARYDYGSAVNRRVYNSPNPPAYNLDQVTMPTALLTGANDRLSTIPDVAILRRQLPNVVYYLENPHSLLNHMDYLWGRNMPVYMLPYVERVLSENNHFLD